MTDAVPATDADPAVVASGSGDRHDPSRPVATRPSTTAAALVVAADLATAFGVVIGFNQLATQSPVDAVLPVALISVGVGGVLSLVAALAGGRRGDDGAGPLGTTAVAPPTLDAGFAGFGLGLVALLAVLGRWGVAAQAAVVGAQGLRLALQAEEGLVRTLRRDLRPPDPYRLGLVAIEALVLLVFALAALADGGVRPFG